LNLGVPRRSVRRVRGRLAAVIALALVLVTGAAAARQADEWTVSITSTPSSVVAGGTFTVSATVTYTYATNNDITLIVQLPDGTPMSTTFNGLSGSQSVSYQVTAPQNAAPGTDLNSTASSTSGYPPFPPSASATTVVVNPPPAISISATPSASQVPLGGTASFAVSATNTGSSPLADVVISNQSGVHWTNEAMSQTGGPGFSCSHPNPFDTNCQISSFPAGATATFTASAVADPTSATIGEILNARFFVFLGGATGGQVYSSAVSSLQVVAATPPTTTTTPAPPAPPPPPTTTTTTATTTTSTTTTTPTPAPAPPCRVPNVRGLKLAAAQTVLALRNCYVAVSSAFSAKVRKGRIVRQSDPPGAKLRSGSVVHIVVSRGRR
jgi:hypothetical protein